MSPKTILLSIAYLSIFMFTNGCMESIEVEQEVEETMGPDPLGQTRLRKVQLPAEAFLKRERLDSQGRTSFRYQGLPIRV